MSRTGRGDIEHFVLVALLRLGGESYGVPILEEIASRTGRDVSRAAVYIALRRLESKGLVASRMGEASAERGGRAKRFYRVRPAGLSALRDSWTALRSMWDGLEPAARKS